MFIILFPSIQGCRPGLSEAAPPWRAFGAAARPDPVLAGPAPAPRPARAQGQASPGPRGRAFPSLSVPVGLPPLGEGAVTRAASVVVPSQSGPLRMVAFKAPVGDILAVVSGTGDGSRVPVRVHDACLTGEVFGSLKCDCGPQLQQTLAAQAARGLGVLVYMPQEGRGIGLANKMAAYFMQEEHGLDTVDANLAIGLPAENRDYSAVKHVLEDSGVDRTPFSKTPFSENDTGPNPAGADSQNCGRSTFWRTEAGQFANRLGRVGVLSANRPPRGRRVVRASWFAVCSRPPDFSYSSSS